MYNREENASAVSVIMPAYNASATIGTAIQSVMDQTFTDWELIVVDDCSRDNTIEVVRSMSDPRIKVVALTDNVRPAAARNIGLRHATGRWFATLDADDAWHPERLRVLTGMGIEGYFVTDIVGKAMPDADGKLNATEPVREQTERLPHADLGSLKDLICFGRNTFPLFPLGSIRAGGIGFPENASGGEWAYFKAKCFAIGLKCKLIEWPGYLYRVTGAHDSSSLKAIEEQYEMDQHLSTVDWVPADAQSIIAQGLPAIRRRLIVAALREHDWKASLRYATKNPRDILYLPGSLFRYAVRQFSLD